MVYPDTFQGYASQSHAHWSDFARLEFKPKTWTEDDVDIEISYCGVCGSDVHMITGVRFACLPQNHPSPFNQKLDGN